MKLKRLALAAALVMSISLSSVSVMAQDLQQEKEIVLYYTVASTAKSELSISETTATCASVAIGNTSTVKITAVQTLEKHWGLWMWDPVNGAGWTKTVNSMSLAMSNTKSGLANGTYRLKTDFTLTTSSGKTETITVYSSEVTI